MFALAASCSGTTTAGGGDATTGIAGASDGSQRIVLSGGGIPARYASGCTPSTLTDFMETESWDVRRVEPYDCAPVRLATPILSWLQPVDFDPSQPFAVRLTRDDGGFDESYTSAVPRLLIRHALQSGAYRWTVRYQRRDGTSAISQPRRFVIAAGETLLAIPTGSALVAAILAKPHPRALPAGSSFGAIAALAANGAYQPSYAGFLHAADADLTAPIAAVPADLTLSDFGGDQAKYDAWQLTLRNQSRDEVAAIETLGYASWLTGKSAYRDAALTRLRALASWPPNGATSEAGQDQVNREIYRVLALGLDLFDASLSATDRQLLAGTFRQRIGQVLPKFAGFARYPYDSHLLTAAQYANEALMYVAGSAGLPDAANELASTWEVMVTTFGSFGSAVDAGYGGGDAYGWYSAGTVARTLAAVELMAGVDLSRWPAAGRFGDNGIALTPPGATLRGQFGDAVEEDTHYASYAFDAHRLLASVTGDAAVDWYWRAVPSNVTYRFPLMPMHYLMLGAARHAPSTTPLALPRSYLFEDAGIVAMHTATEDPARTSVFFRSSRFGAFNHAHADQNSFTFVSRGRALLVSGGYYDYYGSPHHTLVNRATRFKNALTFDGGIGQAEPTTTPTAPGAPLFSMDARGRLVNFIDDGTWAIATGDATLAYRGRDPTTGHWAPLVSAAYRSVAFNRAERVVVIYDWARSGPERRWELNFQTANAPAATSAPASARASVRIADGGASACVDVYAPAGAFATTHGFPVQPTKAAADQFHTRYAVTAPSRELTAVTVIREDCRAVPVQVSLPGGSTAYVTIDHGAPLVADGLMVSIAGGQR